MCLPGHLHDEAYLHAGVLVGPAEAIDNEKPLSGELLLGGLLHNLPNLLGHRVVVVRVLRGVPPNSVLGVLVHNDVLVLRRTSGVDAGHHVDGSELGHVTFLIALKLRLCLLVVENFVSRIVKDFLHALDSVLA